MPTRSKKRQAARTHRVVMLAYPGVQILDVSGPLEVFARTSRWLRDHHDLQRDAYEIELVAPAAGWVETSGGLGLFAARRYVDMRRADTLLISGGIGYRELMQDRKLPELDPGAGHQSRSHRFRLYRRAAACRGRIARR